MIRKEYYQGPKPLTDLKDFDSAGTEIAFFGNVKNLARLKDLDITKLWLFGPKDQELIKILSFVKPNFINIYQVSCKDLRILESLSETETIVLRWGSKPEQLWNMSYNIKLSSLVIEDFQKISKIDAIAEATNLNYLTLEGGMWKALKIDSLSPLSHLAKLRFLRLANMHVKEGGLIPVANLTHLEELMLSNQFETSDYAYLKAKLPNTRCDSFYPFIRYEKPIGNNDTMIVGKRKPFLNSINDADKIEKYAREFNELVKKFSNA